MGRQQNEKPVFIDTCLFKNNFSRVQEYAGTYKEKIGFEILAMFDLPDFEKSLTDQLDLLHRHPISFHGPVFCAEHSAPRGSGEYEETMYHVRKTLHFAKILRSSHFTMHLNNCRVDPARKEQMLENAHENYKELQELFGAIGCPVFVENTGTVLQKNILLDQQEFTDFCRDKKYDVLIDIGHANANGWDIPRLIDDLRPQVRAYHLHNNDGVHDLHNRLHDGTMDFTAILKQILTKTPDAELVIEYTRGELDGPGLHEDIREVIRDSRREGNL